jgi:hypothetical protein
MTVEPMMTTGCSFAGSEKIKERIAPHYVDSGVFVHASISEVRVSSVVRLPPFYFGKT